MQFKAFEPGIEVYGQNVAAVVDAFEHFKHIPSRILAAEKIGKLGPSGAIEFDQKAWYPMEAWLRSFERIMQEVGESKLHTIGLRVPEIAVFPPGIDTIVDGIASLDVAYHMNHRKSGRVMFIGPGKMLEGIGHYGFEQIAPRKIRSVCDNPYPCTFDRGILTSMARRFERNATVAHDETKPCRRNGADSCTYVIEW